MSLTMMKACSVVCLVVMLCAQRLHGAESWPEPEDFRGLRWGASPQEMDALFGSDIYRPPGLPSDTPRAKNFILRNAKVGNADVTVILGFLDDRFASVFIGFKSADFAAVRAAFVTAYGQPAAHTSRTIKDRDGAELVNETLTWKGPTMAILIQKYSSPLTDGLAYLSKHDYREEVLKHQKEQRKGSAKDL